MAAKTSVFYLTERVELTTGATNVVDTIDLGAYVDVADRQGILIHDVDFIFQATTRPTMKWQAFSRLRHRRHHLRSAH